MLYERRGNTHSDNYNVYLSRSKFSYVSDNVPDEMHLDVERVQNMTAGTHQGDRGTHVRGSCSAEPYSKFGANKHPPLIL